jgi:hypothetical protein
MLRDKEDPSLFVFFEVWADKAALDVHSALPHMAEFFENRMQYLERDFDIQMIEMLSAPPLTVDQQVPAEQRQADEEAALEQRGTDTAAQPGTGEHAQQRRGQHQQ